MRVLVGVRCLKHSKAGIGHYTTELIAALKALDHGPKVGTFPGPLLLQGVRAWYDYAPALKRRICSLLKRRGEESDLTSPATDSRARPDEIEEQTRQQQAPGCFAKAPIGPKAYIATNCGQLLTLPNSISTMNPTTIPFLVTYPLWLRSMIFRHCSIPNGIPPNGFGCTRSFLIGLSHPRCIF